MDRRDDLEALVLDRRHIPGHHVTGEALAVVNDERLAIGVSDDEPSARAAVDQIENRFVKSGLTNISLSGTPWSRRYSSVE